MIICTTPPAGWFCTRKPDHNGPCAAYGLSAKSRTDLAWLAEAVRTVAPAQRVALAAAIIADDLMRCQWWLRALAWFLRKRHGFNAREAWAMLLHFTPAAADDFLESTAKWIVAGKDKSGEGVGGFNQTELVKLHRLLKGVGAA